MWLFINILNVPFLRYDMPLVLFVGVNHHGRPVDDFGLCSTIQPARETELIFGWVLSKFLHCMNGVQPEAILTDQCQSIENGIRKTLPQSLHPYCSWHILHKLSSQFGGLANKEDLSLKVKQVVYQSLTTQEFEERWMRLKAYIGYQNESWFLDLYQIREKWVHFSTNKFWAGMTTTQRAESMNAFLRNFLTRKSTLGQFVDFL